MNYIAFVCSVFSFYTITFAEHFKYETILSKDKSLNLQWNVNYADELVKFRIQGRLRPNEWLAFGFSDYGECENADLVLFWKDLFGNKMFKDVHTDNRGNIHIDQNQNYVRTLTEKLKYNRFTLEFIRKFDTCDEDDYKLDNGTTHIIFFTGYGYPKHINTLQYKKGLQRVQILKPDIPDVKIPKDTTFIDVTNQEITVPSTDTTYWWYLTKLPDFKRKYHIIKYEGIIEKGHEHLVHHMELFHCEARPDEVVPSYNGPGLAEGKPPGLSICRKVIGAWAMGASSVTLPEETGTPVGGDGWSRFVLLEVHYNNPQLSKGIEDSSGIRLYVTSKLRKFDSGIMELGLEYTNKMAIPPNQNLFSLTGYCIPDCTRTAIPRTGIHIYASQLHTHMTGKRVYTKHVRNGKELPELNRDNHYSPHFQEIRRLQEPVDVLPGDSLITTCEDSTLDRENITLGGFSIKEEMCVNYIHYYPAVDLEVCKSSVDSDALRAFFRFMNKRYKDNTSSTKSVAENYQSIRWSYLASQMLSNFYDIAPLSMQCNRSDGTRFPGNWNNKDIPRITLPITTHSGSC
ncbi:dopamine beta-hydroxylase-like [Mytilus galloprovincialis]|uniref:dopamine beta-hydroxylase-like n=1 Tax=Mytilus galloprovincialis TaxID=29158 RepID=UPI003F7BB534